jgi:hypothetical protein
VAFGDFLIEEPFILGPAVDEAAEAERVPEGAFVWLCPSPLKEALATIPNAAIALARSVVRTGLQHEGRPLESVWVGDGIVSSTRRLAGVHDPVARGGAMKKAHALMLVSFLLVMVTGCSSASHHCRPGDEATDDGGKVRCTSPAKRPSPGESVTVTTGGSVAVGGTTGGSVAVGGPIGGAAVK